MKRQDSPIPTYCGGHKGHINAKQSVIQYYVQGTARQNKN